ncbi:MAG: hypothetical protein KGH71_04295 [Candidatus Micrarchaeota archaeon]|nr:hypothetical protein [Candidatus Micrarchaeota archaeon]
MANMSEISNRFIWSAIVQGAVLTLVTFVLFIYGSAYLTPSPAVVIASGSAGLWLMLGYVMYIIMILALGITALFYDYIEVRLGRRLDGISLLFAQAQLILMNVGIFGATLLLMYAGYVGGAGLLPTALGGGGLSELQAHVQILSPFPPEIIAFVILTMLGALCGGIAYLRALLAKKK